MKTNEAKADVVVVGAGNAGLVAAIAAAESGRRVVVLERAPESMAGGNSYYTAGATRITHAGLDDLLPVLEPDERHRNSVVPPYSAEDYAQDLEKVTEGRNDPELTRTLVADAGPTVRWLHDAHDVHYRLMYERQSYRDPDTGEFVFWGGLHVGNVDGGVGLVRDLFAAAHRLGIEIRYDWFATGLLTAHGRVTGVTGVHRGRAAKIDSTTVVLAAGGFEASPDLRRKHLGEGWEHARLRGTPYNDGTMLDAALGLGAAPGGDWESCHSVAWDAEYPANESNRELTNRLTRQSYPLGIIVNREGRRFVDEGADFRNYTYAKYGREILAQPGSIAYQVFDAQTRPMLRTEEYDMPNASVYEAATLHELAEAAGINADGFCQEIAAFNDGIDVAPPFNPSVKDGKASHVTPPKSNWALPIAEPPFFAFPVTCGITFTFGGLRGTPDGKVLNGAAEPIPGLFAAGEMLGGLFSRNYPGGSGLAAGMVFGRRAGRAASDEAGRQTT